MRWQSGRRSANVEDRRGMPVSRGAAVGGLGGCPELPFQGLGAFRFTGIGLSSCPLSPNPGQTAAIGKPLELEVIEAEASAALLIHGGRISGGRSSLLRFDIANIVKTRPVVPIIRKRPAPHTAPRQTLNVSVPDGKSSISRSSTVRTSRRTR